MEKEEFYKMLDSKQYKELEEKLKEEYNTNGKLEAKYQLGICYGEQFEKIENAAEKLISNAPQKFIDGMKNFSNFVHPGKELREKLLEIDKQTVDLLMSIVRWLILTLHLK